MYLLDYRINDKVRKYFDERKIPYMTTVKNCDLYEEISGHPDIVACKIGDVAVLEAATYDLLSKRLCNYNIVRGDTRLKGKYPFDIAYNVVTTDKYLIGNIRYVDNVIKNIAKRKNLELIDVRQGYTRCSTAVIGGIFITSDISIYKKLKNHKLDVYYVEVNDIFLSSRYNGFLGGACAYIDERLLFFGSIKKSRSYEKMMEILENKRIRYENIFDGQLVDYGSIIQIPIKR